MNARNIPQPPPVTTSSPDVWPTIFDNPNLALPDWLIADMRERHELGVKKYGVALQVNNGRDALVDAYQESLDLLVYSQQARMRLGTMSLRAHPGHVNARLMLDLVFHETLKHARWLGDLIQSEKRPEALR
jgi:hypothetical protein